MPVTDETLRLAAEIRIRIDSHVDQVTRDLVRSYARGWQQLVRDWQDARNDIAAAYGAGERPTVGQLVRLEKVKLALAATRDLLDDLGRLAGVRIVQDLDGLLEEVSGSQMLQMASQLPPVSVGATFAADLVRADRRQIAAIIRRVTGEVTSKAAKFGPVGEQIMRDQLVRSVALGLNPRTTAQTILDQGRLLAGLQHGFNATLNDAMVIARTELLDATRAAAQETHQANSSVCTQWMWLAQLDTRTCPSCWGMHGTLHPQDDPGPDDHQQGRCTRMPVVKSWKELGYAVPEPPSLIPDAEQIFAGLTRADQVAIMGPARLAALDAGEIGWGQLSMVRHTSGWRRSFAPAPVRTLRRRRSA